MNELPVITSRRNPRVVAAVKLKQRKHRLRQGRFLVEGLSILAMALDAGARPLEVFLCRERLAGAEVGQVLDRLLAAGADPVPVSSAVIESLAERQAVEGILATFALFEHRLEALPLSGWELVVVLDRLQDPGNLGTLLRTADAAGAAAVVLVEPCADPFDPKTVRGTMGSLFHVPVVRTGQVDALFGGLQGVGLRVVGADAHRGRPWDETVWSGGVALVLGNEARGLSEDVRDHVEAWARLPIAGRAESLNVAVAGGILMYEWVRVNGEASRQSPVSSR